MKTWLVFPQIAVGLLFLGTAKAVELTVHTDQTTKTISPGIYGQFLEHIFNSVHGGLWGDQILNGTFESTPQRRVRNGESGAAPAPRHWEFAGDKSKVSMD